MTGIFAWLVRIAGILLALALLGLGLMYYFVTRSLPDYDRDYVLSSAPAPVEIVRDRSNIPHILGQTDAASFYGLGFAHAQDRLWQMMILRRTAQGKLSEMFGDRTVETDILMRELGLYDAAQDAVDAQSPAARVALAAYAAGVNAWIAQVNSGALGRGAPEYFLFAPELAPWQPADSLAILKLLALRMTPHAGAEVLRARTGLIVGPDRLADILPDVPGAPMGVLASYRDMLPDGARLPRDWARLDRPMLWPLPAPGRAGASNVWAAAPDRTALGGTLLANDPHTDLTAPAQWYLARLNLDSGPVIGASVPGLPLILSGRSAHLGWGIAASFADDQDLVLEQLDPENPERYKTPDGYAPFFTQKRLLRIRDSQPVTLTLRATRNGPILSGDAWGLGAVTPAGHVMALQWTGLAADDPSFSALMDVMQSNTVAQADTAAQSHVAPSLSLMLADRHGIALRVIGARPKRDPDHPSQGRLPVPGWIQGNVWTGMLPPSTAPAASGGLIGVTNNKLTDAPFPEHLSFLWGDTQRILRWNFLMEDRAVQSRESFVEAQLDTVSTAARSLLALVGRDLFYPDRPDPADFRAVQRAEALALLVQWNGEMNEHMPEPLIYAAWMRNLQDILIRDDLGLLAAEFPALDPVFIERVFRDIDGAAQWCDIVQSTPVEDCTRMADRALEAALIDLETRFGRNIESWRWGDAHLATQDHPVLGHVSVLGPLLNLRQSTSGGDFTLMRGRLSNDPAHPYRNVHGASYRGVYDFTDPDSSLFILSTGQSGHPLSRHYDDLGELWRRGEYLPMSLDVDLARAAAIGVTVITPAAD